MTTSTRRDKLLLGSALATGLASTARAETVGQPQPTKPPGIAAAGPKIAPYRASCVRSLVRPVFGSDGAFRPDALKANVERIAGLIARGAAETDSRLYSFSEFCLQSAPNGASVAAWEKAAIRIPGPEIERIGREAQKAKAYVCLNVAERIDAFPGRYFLSGVIIGPSGDVVLNYRKLYDLTNKSRPSDLLPKWLDTFGADSLFPVADTPIGRLAVAVALDVNWPEMIRGFVFKGAEVILNPTASPATPNLEGLDIRESTLSALSWEVI